MVAVTVHPFHLIAVGIHRPEAFRADIVALLEAAAAGGVIRRIGFDGGDMRLCGFFALYRVAVEVQTAFTDRADLVLLMVAGLTGKARIVALAVGDMRCRGITGLYRIAVGVQKTATDRAEAERHIDAAPTGQKVRVMELAAAGVRTVSSDPLHRCTVYINRVSAVHANIEVRLESAITGGVICRVLLSAGRMRLFCGRIRIQPRAILVHNSATCDTMVMWNLNPP